MEVAKPGVKSTKDENTAAMRGGIRQYMESKDRQCYKCLGFGHMSYQCTLRMRCINCRKEGQNKAVDCFQLENNNCRGNGQRGGHRRG